MNNSNDERQIKSESTRDTSWFVASTQMHGARVEHYGHTAQEAKNTLKKLLKPESEEEQ